MITYFGKHGRPLERKHDKPASSQVLTWLNTIQVGKDP
jgi:hypothetical protein